MNTCTAIKATIPQYDLSLDDRLKFRGIYWSVSRRRAGVLDFIDPRTGELFSCNDEELAGLICSGSAAIVRAGASAKDEQYAAAVVDLTTLPKQHIADGQRSLFYTDELRSRGLLHRPPTNEVEAAIAHVAARIGDPQPPAVYLVKRWQKRALTRSAASGRREQQTVVSDFVPQHAFKGNRTNRICFEVSKIIHEQISLVYLTPERRSFESLLACIRNEVRLANEQRAPDDHLALPGRKAVAAAVESLPRDEVKTARHGQDRAYDEFGPVQYRERPLAPLDEVEIDHTPCDLFVVDDLTGAPLGRPTIVLGIDRCTAMPWGMHMGFDPPSVHTVMQCLRNGMFPKNYVRIYADAGIWDIQGEWPVFGRPQKIAVDRGAENINHDMRALGADLPIKIIEAKAGRKGRLKGGIERFLGTLNRTLLQEQRGTTFSNILARKDYDARKNAVITYSELLGKIHQWICDVYIPRRHNGIKDIPLRLWNSKIAQHRPDQVENVEKLLPLFGRIEHRVLRRDGIRWKNLFFTSPDLMALLTNSAFVKASTTARGDITVRFRYDPSSIDRIQVYLPHARGQDSMHLEVPVERRATEYASGLSVWAHDAITQMAAAEVKGAIDLAALDRARSKLIQIMEADTPGSAKARGQARLARLRQIGGVAPYGTTTRTTPAGSLEDQRQLAAMQPTELAGSQKPSRRQAANDGLPMPRDVVVEDEIANIIDPPAKTPKSKSKRAEDPKVAIMPATKVRRGKGRPAVPRTAVTHTAGEIDFYSDEVSA